MRVEMHGFAMPYTTEGKRKYQRDGRVSNSATFYYAYQTEAGVASFKDPPSAMSNQV